MIEIRRPSAEKKAIETNCVLLDRRLTALPAEVVAGIEEEKRTAVGIGISNSLGSIKFPALKESLGDRDGGSICAHGFPKICPLDEGTGQRNH